MHLYVREGQYAAFVVNYDNGGLPDYHNRPLVQGQPQVDPEISTKLPAEVVWSIVCRWHAMKVLFDLYFDSTIRPFYLQSLLPHQPWRLQTEQWVMEVAYETPMPPPSGRDIESLQTAEKQRAYERFYRGLCSHWTTVDELWLARISRYSTSKLQFEAFDKIWALWLDHPARDVREKLQAVEIIEFVWGFLGRKIFRDPERLSDWLLGEDAEEEFLDDSPSGNWMYFVHVVSQYLRPPQIIELLDDMWNPRSKPFDKATYLHSSGLFDSSRKGYREAIDGDGSSPNTFYPVEYIEADGMNRLFKHYRVEEDPEDVNYESPWDRYKYCQWVNHLRGRALLSPDRTQRTTAPTNELLGLLGY
jgi:hypothetical protein